MNRREFFRRAALVAAGVVAADQLELLERLAHRKVFALGGIEPRSGLPAEYLRQVSEVWLAPNPLFDDLRWTTLPPERAWFSLSYPGPRDPST